MIFEHTFLVECNILKGMLNMELKNAQIVQRPCYSLKMNFRVGLPMRFLPTKKESNTTFVRNGNLFFFFFFPNRQMEQDSLVWGKILRLLQ